LKQLNFTTVVRLIAQTAGWTFSKSWRDNEEKNYAASGYGTLLVQPIATGVLQRTVVMAGVVILKTTKRVAMKTAIGCMCRPLQITMKSYTEIFLLVLVTFLNITF
jgi:hypothetical protein